MDLFDTAMALRPLLLVAYTYVTGIYSACAVKYLATEANVSYLTEEYL